MESELVEQCSGIRHSLIKNIPELELNDICYAYDVLCYLLSSQSNQRKLADQNQITNRTIDKKVDILHQTARFAFDLDLDSHTYQQVGRRYIELVQFNTDIMKDFSIRDNLTGALSFDYLKSLNERLSKEHFLLFFFDLNNFKALNDAYGHEFGNQALKAFAGVLIDNVQINDLVFRYGGDEFIILLFDTDIDPNQLITRLNRQLNYDIQYSVGWAYNTERDLFKTIKLADSLMYKNKRRLE
ncbi:GGDEF domain-containing protein [Vibrio ichthyoenteri ATCC 700023]|uniref:diguanylate cyclase n=2 Tax=Vibrio ichthyoenteri TaxID=142461 RepID=F9S3C5_9VIBR|nr:GGDEF domain-containing protein [Vibrio ichthyoenteri ATCC 700023]